MVKHEILYYAKSCIKHFIRINVLDLKFESSLVFILNASMP